MALTTIATADRIEAYSETVYRELLRDTVLSQFISKKNESIIQETDTALGKGKGERYRVTLVRNLTGAGRVGNQRLTGHSEALDTLFSWHWLMPRQHSLEEEGDLTRIRSQLDLAKEFGPALRRWATVKLDVDIIKALSGLANTELGFTTDGTNYYAPSTNRKWRGGQTAAGVVEQTTTDASVDSATANLCGPEVIDAVKLKAVEANIGPGSLNGEYLFAYIISRKQEYDLIHSTTWKNAMLYAQIRGRDNPLFRRNAKLRFLGIWNDVAIYCSNLIESRTGDGVGTAATTYFESGDACASGITVHRSLFLGQQAGSIGWGLKPEISVDKIEKRFDMVMLHEIYGVGKSSFATNAGAQEDFSTIIVDTAVSA